VTGQTAHGGLDLVNVGWIHHVGHRMTFHRVTQSVAHGEDHDPVLHVVIVGQLHCAVEDGDQVLGFQPLRLRVRTMTLQAQRIAFGAQQVLVVAAVRLMADGTALSEGRLMQVRFLELLGLVAVAGQAGIHRIGLDEARRLAGVRLWQATHSPAPRMLHLSLLDLLRLFGVAGHAERLRIRLRQDDFAVLAG